MCVEYSLLSNLCLYIPEKPCDFPDEAVQCHDSADLLPVEQLFHPLVEFKHCLHPQ